MINIKLNYSTTLVVIVFEIGLVSTISTWEPTGKLAELEQAE
jgi:hypothetical protein